jgi:Dual specificity phosphatase, catalytic domain
MEVFEVVPGLSIGTRLAETADYDSLGVDVVIDLEDWDWAWVPSVPLGKVFVSFPMQDEDDVDPKVRDVAAFVASLVGSGRKVLVHCTEGLNRSGVVIARALMEMGQSAPEAIELVRRGRGPSVDGFPALGKRGFHRVAQRRGPLTCEPAFHCGMDAGLEHLDRRYTSTPRRRHSTTQGRSERNTLSYPLSPAASGDVARTSR